MDMDISSDSSSSDEDTATALGHIGTPTLVCPSQTVCQMRNFDNFRLGAFFLSIYDTLIECCRYPWPWEIRPVYT